MRQVVIDRRTFLKVAGVSAAGMLAAPAVVAQSAIPSGAAPGLDPLLDLALDLGLDMERMFRFVAEEIRYEPYAGALRGPHGTVMGGAGNSVDQALLLASLLDASRIAYRFAVGPLRDDHVDALLAGEPATAEEVERQTLDSIAGIRPYGRPFPSVEPDAGTLARLEAAQADADQVAAWAHAQLDSTLTTIESALAEQGIAVAADAPRVPTPELERHVWVQAREGTEWLDLDPSVPGTVPGTAVATADSTHNALPDDLRHLVRLRVVLEKMAGGGLATETLVEFEGAADAIAGEPIGLINIEFEGIKSIGVGITGALEGGTTYVPCLMVGETTTVGPGWLRFGGDPADDPFGGADTAAGARDGEPTAQWLEITLSAPGSDPVTVRRPVFDRIGPALRASGNVDPATLAPVTLSQLEPSGPPDFLPALTTHWLTLHTGLTGGAQLATRLRPVSSIDGLPSLVHGYHLTSEAVAAFLAPPLGIRTFIDAPNVVSLTVEQAIDDAGDLAIRAAADIWHRSFGTLPMADIAPSRSPAMVPGVIAHLAERFLVGDPLRDRDGLPAPASVGAVFDTVRRDQSPVRAIRGGDALDDLGFAPDVRARLAEALGSGLVAVVPQHPVTLGGREVVGWWLVDPRTGRVTDQLDDGRGTVGETTVIIRRRAEDTPALRRMGCFVGGVWIGASLAMMFAGASGIASGQYAMGAVVLATGVAGAAGGTELAISGCV